MKKINLYREKIINIKNILRIDTTNLSINQKVMLTSILNGGFKDAFCLMEITNVEKKFKIYWHFSLNSSTIMLLRKGKIRSKEDSEFIKRTLKNYYDLIKIRKITCTETKMMDKIKRLKTT